MKATIGYKVRFNHLDQLSADLREGVSLVVQAAGQAVAAQAKVNIQESPHSGRIYKKSNPEREHQASAPGEAPATDLGTLVNSIGAAMVNDVTSVVTVSSEHGLYMEFGAPRVHVEARPFLGPALDQVFPSIKENLRAVVGQAISGKGVKLVRRSAITKEV